MGLTILGWMFFTFMLNDRIFCRILSVPQNIAMGMNNVMMGCLAMKFKFDVHIGYAMTLLWSSVR